MAAITFNLRIPTARPLTPAEHDENFNNVDDVFTGDVSSATMNDAKRMMGLLLTPANVIFPFTGAIATIPTGFALCDGSAWSTTLGSGTLPDLTDTFLVGAIADDGGVAKTTITDAVGPTYSKSGGTTQHGHALSVVVSETSVTLSGAQSGMPAHEHTYSSHTAASGSQLANLGLGGSDLTVAASWSTTGGSAIGATAGHDHSVTVDSATATETQHIPSFYALAYITYIGV